MEIADIRRARLKQWFANKTLPQKEKSYFSQLMSGTASFGERAARRLERDYGMGNKYLDQPPGTEQSSLGVPAEFTIPLLSWVRAGDFCEAAGQFTLSDAEEMLPSPLSSTSKNTFALQVRGDSMDTPDGYREGEIVYIDPDISPTPGRDVLAKTDSGITLKRYKVDEEGPYLLQLNGNKIIRPEGPWHVCGVVVFSGRKR